jgi:hypothetical protein
MSDGRWKTTASARFTPLLFLALAISGCCRASRVSGRVSYRGQPLPEGTVMLLAGDGRVYDGSIQSDGTFMLSDVPAGVAKVCVTSMTQVRDQKTDSTPNDPRTKRRTIAKSVVHSRIPTKYGAFDQSGLTVTVQKGAVSMLDLDLK